MSTLEAQERWTIFDVAAFTMWSDKRLAAAEVSVARAIAEQLDVPLDQAGARLRGGVDELGELALSPLGADLAYAVAAWVALADGVEHPAERAVLRMLGYRLGLTRERTTEIESHAYVCSWDRSGPTAHARFDALVRAIHGLGADSRAPTYDMWEAAE
ncbi:MAG: hypothetical protein AB8I08_03640 [Sandaracinaceae bacterium]